MQIDVTLGENHFRWQAAEGIEGSLSLNEDPNCSFRQFLRISSDTDFRLTTSTYDRVAQNFVSSSFVAPLLMPKQLLKKSLREAERSFLEAVSTEDDMRYFESWSKINDFLNSLKPALIDKQALESTMHDKNAETSRALLSFMPDESGFSKKVVYNTSDSLTGRMKVVSGPQVLTAAQEVRSCIRSTFEGGQVLLVDFRSVEPRIAMIYTGQSAPDDVYSDLMEEFPDLTRKAAKLATLVALYGGAAGRLSEVVGDPGSARKAIDFTKSHFRVDRLNMELESQAKRDIVRNVLGRPLREATKNPRIRVNHFLQSSAADLAPLLYAELCDKFKGTIRPLFMIHDALIVDLPHHLSEDFKKEAESIQWRGNKMPVKIDTLSPT